MISYGNERKRFYSQSTFRSGLTRMITGDDGQIYYVNPLLPGNRYLNPLDAAAASGNASNLVQFGPGRANAGGTAIMDQFVNEVFRVQYPDYVLNFIEAKEGVDLSVWTSDNSLVFGDAKRNKIMQVFDAEGKALKEDQIFKIFADVFRPQMSLGPEGELPDKIIKRLSVIFGSKQIEAIVDHPITLSLYSSMEQTNMDRSIGKQATFLKSMGFSDVQSEMLARVDAYKRMDQATDGLSIMGTDVAKAMKANISAEIVRLEARIGDVPESERRSLERLIGQKNKELDKLDLVIRDGGRYNIRGVNLKINEDINVQSLLDNSKTFETQRQSLLVQMGMETDPRRRKIIKGALDDVNEQLSMINKIMDAGYVQLKGDVYIDKNKRGMDIRTSIKTVNTDLDFDLGSRAMISLEKSATEKIGRLNPQVLAAHMELFQDSMGTMLNDHAQQLQEAIEALERGELPKVAEAVLESLEVSDDDIVRARAAQVRDLIADPNLKLSDNRGVFQFLANNVTESFFKTRNNTFVEPQLEIKGSLKGKITTRASLGGRYATGRLKPGMATFRDGIGWVFHEEDYSPTIAAQTGGSDLDDSITGIIRTVQGQDGELSLKLIGIRDPTSRGELAVLDISMTDRAVYNTILDNKKKNEYRKINKMLRQKEGELRNQRAIGNTKAQARMAVIQNDINVLKSQRSAILSTFFDSMPDRMPPSQSAAKIALQGDETDIAVGKRYGVRNELVTEFEFEDGGRYVGLAPPDKVAGRRGVKIKDLYDYGNAAEEARKRGVRKSIFEQLRGKAGAADEGFLGINTNIDMAKNAFIAENRMKFINAGLGDEFDRLMKEALLFQYENIIDASVQTGISDDVLKAIPAVHARAMEKLVEAVAMAKDRGIDDVGIDKYFIDQRVASQIGDALVTINDGRAVPLDLEDISRTGVFSDFAAGGQPRMDEAKAFLKQLVKAPAVIQDDQALRKSVSATRDANMLRSRFNERQREIFQYAEEVKGLSLTDDPTHNRKVWSYVTAQLREDILGTVTDELFEDGAATDRTYRAVARLMQMVGDGSVNDRILNMFGDTPLINDTVRAMSGFADSIKGTTVDDITDLTKTLTSSSVRSVLEDMLQGTDISYDFLDRLNIIQEYTKGSVSESVRASLESLPGMRIMADDGFYSGPVSASTRVFMPGVGGGTTTTMGQMAYDYSKGTAGFDKAAVRSAFRESMAAMGQVAESIALDTDLPLSARKFATRALVDEMPSSESAQRAAEGFENASRVAEPITQKSGLGNFVADLMKNKTFRRGSIGAVGTLTAAALLRPSKDDDITESDYAGLANQPGGGNYETPINGPSFDPSAPPAYNPGAGMTYRVRASQANSGLQDLISAITGANRIDTTTYDDPGMPFQSDSERFEQISRYR